MLSGDRRGASVRRGMTVLGRIPAVPKPINLPSQRLENRGLDPNVEIVPRGGVSWGSAGRSPPTINNAWGAGAQSSSPPQANGTWGGTQKQAPVVSGSGAAWGGTAQSRPSSAGSGTRPSSAGSVGHNQEPQTAAAWGPPLLQSRPVPVSATPRVTPTPVVQAQTQGAVHSQPPARARPDERPRSAEARPVQGPRLGEPPSFTSAPAWNGVGGDSKLAREPHQPTAFQLTRVDFPTLGSEKSPDLRPQQGAANMERPAEDKVFPGHQRQPPNMPGHYEEMPRPPVGYGASERPGLDTWRRDPPYGPLPGSEGNWHREDHRHIASHEGHPSVVESWRRESGHDVSPGASPSEESWRRGGPLVGPSGPHVPHAHPRFAHDPSGFPPQQRYGPGPGPGPVPYGRGGPSGYGHHVGDVYGNTSLLARQGAFAGRPGPPLAPGMYPGQGPVAYEGPYAGPPMEDRGVMMLPQMGMNGPGVYFQGRQGPPPEVLSRYPHGSAGAGPRLPANGSRGMRDHAELAVPEGEQQELGMYKDNRAGVGQDSSGSRRLGGGVYESMRPGSQGGNMGQQHVVRDWGASANEEPMDFSKPVFEEDLSPGLKKESVSVSLKAHPAKPEDGAASTVGPVRTHQQAAQSRPSASEHMSHAAAATTDVEGAGTVSVVPVPPVEVAAVIPDEKIKGMKRSSTRTHQQVVQSRPSVAEHASHAAAVGPEGGPVATPDVEGGVSVVPVTSVDIAAVKPEEKIKGTKRSGTTTRHGASGEPGSTLDAVASNVGVASSKDHAIKEEAPHKARTAHDAEKEWRPKATSAESKVDAPYGTRMLPDEASGGAACLSGLAPEAPLSGAEKGEPDIDPSTAETYDYEAQRAKMKEIAHHRSLQLQKEEEERTKEQKAKAFAKLEELNRRATGVPEVNKVSTRKKRNSRNLKSKQKFDAVDGSTPVAVSSEHSDVGEAVEKGEPCQEVVKGDDACSNSVKDLKFQVGGIEFGDLDLQKDVLGIQSVSPRSNGDTSSRRPPRKAQSSKRPRERGAQDVRLGDKAHLSEGLIWAPVRQVASTAAAVAASKVPPSGEHKVPPSGEHKVPPSGEHKVPPSGEHKVPPSGEHKRAQTDHSRHQNEHGRHSKQGRPQSEHGRHQGEHGRPHADHAVSQNEKVRPQTESQSHGAEKPVLQTVSDQGVMDVTAHAKVDVKTVKQDQQVPAPAEGTKGARAPEKSTASSDEEQRNLGTVPHPRPGPKGHWITQTNGGQHQSEQGRADHGRSQPEHGRPQSEHGRTQPDHGRPQTDHGRPQTDHGRPHNDHWRTQRQTDHSRHQNEYGRHGKHGRPQPEYGRHQADHGRQSDQGDQGVHPKVELKTVQHDQQVPAPAEGAKGGRAPEKSAASSDEQRNVGTVAHPRPAPKGHGMTQTNGGEHQSEQGRVDHGRLQPDHGRPQTDHGRLQTDHGRPQNDHWRTQRQTDHNRHQNEHGRHSKHGRPQSEYGRHQVDHGRQSDQVDQGVTDVTAHAKVDLRTVKQDQQVSALPEGAKGARAPEKSAAASDEEQRNVGAAAHPRPGPKGHGMTQTNGGQQQSEQGRGDHGRPQPDHGRPQTDHGRPQTDHGRPHTDHGRPHTDHGRPQTDHGRTQADHGRTQTDHGRNQTDHGRPQSDHGKPQNDHGRPQSDHGRPQNDHWRTQRQTDHSRHQNEYGRHGKHGRPQTEYGRHQVDHGRQSDQGDQGVMDVTAHPKVDLKTVKLDQQVTTLSEGTKGGRAPEKSAASSDEEQRNVGNVAHPRPAPKGHGTRAAVRVSRDRLRVSTDGSAKMSPGGPKVEGQAVPSQGGKTQQAAPIAHERDHSGQVLHQQFRPVSNSRQQGLRSNRKF